MSNKFDHLSGESPEPPEYDGVPKEDDWPTCAGCGIRLKPYPGIGLGCPSSTCSYWDIRLDKRGRKD